LFKKYDLKYTGVGLGQVPRSVEFQDALERIAANGAA